jgi:hypothetical protein
LELQAGIAPERRVVSLNVAFDRSRVSRLQHAPLRLFRVELVDRREKLVAILREILRPARFGPRLFTMYRAISRAETIISTLSSGIVRSSRMMPTAWPSPSRSARSFDVTSGAACRIHALGAGSAVAASTSVTAWAAPGRFP